MYLYLIILFGLVLSLDFTSAGPGNCPSACICTKFRSVCTLVYCTDKFDSDTSLLVLHGKLCSNHYQDLYQLRNVNKELHSSTCRTLPLCDDSPFRDRYKYRVVSDNEEDQDQMTTPTDNYPVQQFIPKSEVDHRIVSVEDYTSDPAQTFPVDEESGKAEIGQSWQEKILWGLFYFGLSSIGGILSFFIMFHCFKNRRNTQTASIIATNQGQRQQQQQQQHQQAGPPAQPPAPAPTAGPQDENIYQNIDNPGVLRRAVGTVTSPIRKLWGDKGASSSGVGQTEMQDMSGSSGQAQNKQAEAPAADQVQAQSQQVQKDTSLTELKSIASGKPVQPTPPTELQRVADSAKNAQVAISKSLSRKINSVSKKIPMYDSLKDFILANPKKTVDNVPFPYLSQEWYRKELPNRGESGPVLHTPIPGNTSSTIPTLLDESDYLEPDNPPTTQAPTPPVTSPNSISSIGSKGKSGGRAGRAKTGQESQLQRPNTRSVTRENQNRKISAKAKTVTDRLAKMSSKGCNRK